MLIQILITIFALFAILSLIKSKKFLWMFFWLIVGVIVWMPNLTNIIATNLGIGRGADLIFYFSILILFFLIFKIYIKIEKIERNITKIVRKDSLDKS
jgi:hypothetical protein